MSLESIGKILFVFETKQNDASTQKTNNNMAMFNYAYLQKKLNNS